MKKIIIIPLFFLLFISGYSQDLNFEIRETYSRAVKKEKLNEAQTMSELIPGYPTSWISEYISTQILVNSNESVMQAMGTNDILSTEQKSILQIADMGTNIIVDVTYKYKNSVTDDMDIHTMHYSATVVPEIQAEYPGGYQPMTQYLKGNAIDKISKTSIQQDLQAIIRFTVTEDGEIANARISTTSGDEKTDKLLLKAITKMPKWRPAENAKGIKVKQDFEFSVGNVGC